MGDAVNKDSDWCEHQVVDALRQWQVESSLEEVDHAIPGEHFVIFQQQDSKDSVISSAKIVLRTLLMTRRAFCISKRSLSTPKLVRQELVTLQLN